MHLRNLSCYSLFLGLMVLISLNATGQIKESTYTVSLAAQINLQYNTGRNAFRNNLPGIKVSIGLHSYNRLNNFKKSSVYPLLNYATSLTIYNKSLGNSLNVNYQDNQVDWTSNINLGIADGETNHTKQLHSINNVPFYSIVHKADKALFIGTNFIMNTARRHQTVGQIAFTYDNFSMNYYNDGGPPINWLGLGDGFDRFWTGGIMFYNHTQREIDTLGYNRWEFSFDQFTGYRPQLFQLQSIVGLDIQDYDIYDYKVDSTDVRYNLTPSKTKGYSFNASQYQVRYFTGPDLAINVGIVGSLRDVSKERYYALQDIIHVLRRDPVHPNFETNRIQLGINYYNKIK